MNISKTSSASRSWPSTKNISLFFQHPLTKVELTIDLDHPEPSLQRLEIHRNEAGSRFISRNRRKNVIWRSRIPAPAFRPTCWRPFSTASGKSTGRPPRRLRERASAFRWLRKSSTSTADRSASKASSATDPGSWCRASKRDGLEEITDRRQSDMPWHTRNGTTANQEGTRVQDIVSNARDLQLADLGTRDFQPEAKAERRHLSVAGGRRQHGSPETDASSTERQVDLDFASSARKAFGFSTNARRTHSERRHDARDGRT